MNYNRRNRTRYQEVAKTFHWREFGNGSANEGTVVVGQMQVCFIPLLMILLMCMDDGLTSLSFDVLSLWHQIVI